MSVLEGYAADPSELFKAAEAVSGVSEAAINEAYAALTQGCFTFPPPATQSPSAPPPNTSDTSAPVRDESMYGFASYGQGKGVSIDLRSFLLTGLVEVACAVITGGLSTVFKVKTIAEVATQMVGDAGKTAKDNGQETNNPIEDHPLIIDTVKQYLDAMAKIERDTASAISDLSLHLHTKLAELEQHRQYQNLLTNVSSDMAPQFLDYAKGWRA